MKLAYDTTPFKTISDDTLNIKAELESGVLPLGLIPNTLTGKSAQYLGGHAASEFLLLAGGTVSGALTLNGAVTIGSTMVSSSTISCTRLTAPTVVATSLGYSASDLGITLSSGGVTILNNKALVCNAGAEATLASGQARNVYISNQDPSSSVGNIGEIWFKYA